MSVVTVITPPSTTYVTLAEARAHVRADAADDDVYLEGLIEAAEAHLDTPGAWFGRSIGRRTLEMDVPSPCGPVVLPYPPYVDLVSITYADPAGAEHVLDLGGITARRWLADTVRLAPTSGTWPAMSAEGMRIRYVAGYAPGDVRAAPIRQAILLMVAHWYANREPINIGNITSTLDFTLEALLNPLRVWGL